MAQVSRNDVHLSIDNYLAPGQVHKVDPLPGLDLVSLEDGKLLLLRMAMIQVNINSPDAIAPQNVNCGQHVSANFHFTYPKNFMARGFKRWFSGIPYTASKGGNPVGNPAAITSIFSPGSMAQDLYGGTCVVSFVALGDYYIGCLGLELEIELARKDEIQQTEFVGDQLKLPG